MKIAIYSAIALAVLCGGYIVYLVYLVLDTYARAKLAPREAMLMCPKHGPIRKQHIIRFQIGPNDFVEQCPRCFHDTLSGAERVR